MTFAEVQHVEALMPETHQAINEQVAKTPMNGFSLDDYLKNNLGIIGGIKQTYQTKPVLEWINLGGKYEDIPAWYLQYIRSANHFHNPLTDNGFSGVWGSGVGSGISAITWMQLSPGLQLVGGSYAWSDVRKYYIDALTATSLPTRETNFADTFRGIGQLMHLVEDMSVPEHTRDDGHYRTARDQTTYEGWVSMTQSLKPGIPGPILNDAVANPVFFSSQFLANNQSQFTTLWLTAPVPVANLFDTNQYTGSNPQVTSNNPTIGLSEYSHANFLSPDTMWKYPYPAFDTNIQIYEAPYYATTYSGTETVNRVYLRKTGDGDSIEHLAVTDLYCNAISSPADCGFDYSKAFYFTEGDEQVYQDYASHLLPRAVGYSASLLQYFFRGQIEISLPDRYVYAIADPFSGSFNKDFKVKAKNVTANGEPMFGGQIQLVIKYQDHGINPIQYPDLTHLTSLPDSLTNPSPMNFKYIVIPEKNLTNYIPSDNPVELTFDLSTAGSSIPYTASDISIQVVFKGSLGNEPDSAVAVGYKDISEPTPLDFSNDLDQICLSGIPTLWSSPTAVTFAQNNPNSDLYSHNLSKIFIKFSSPQATKVVSPTDYNVSFSNIPPGYYGRVYFLSDTAGYHISLIDNVEPVDSTIDTFSHYSEFLEWSTAPVQYQTDFSTYSTTVPITGQSRGVAFFDMIYSGLYTYPDLTKTCSESALDSAQPNLVGIVMPAITP